MRNSFGLSAAVYTQTTDVETELNGLWTYDREVMKLDAAKVRPAIMALYLPLPPPAPVAKPKVKSKKAK